jgi:hypothetical protein
MLSVPKYINLLAFLKSLLTLLFILQLHPREELQHLQSLQMASFMLSSEMFLCFELMVGFTIEQM